MKKITIVTVWLITSFSFVYGQKMTEPFDFQFENKTLRGLIETPEHTTSSAVILIIPGYGKTDFVAGNWFSELRDSLVATGLTVVFWDKMGCGQSEGEFNVQQPVANSADEAVAAIKEIQRRKLVSAEKIGLWGISRAGWICPLINERFPIDFWISVSGTDDKENFGYLLKENLLIHGVEEKEANVLFQAWMKGHRLFCTQAKYEDYLEAIQPLSQDSICRKLFGYVKQSVVTEAGRSYHLAQQKLYTAKGHFDEESGLWVYIDDFDEKLDSIKCPVLALFGADDSQVNWRKTKQLYERTIGQNANDLLTIEVFDDCNHSLQKCVSCAYQEDLSSLNWESCNGYYGTIKTWLKDEKFIR